MKKTILILVAVIIILVAATLVYFVLQDFGSKQNREEDKREENNLIGGERDEHGCFGPAGYSWCEASQKCLRIFEEFCEDEADDLVSELETASDVKLTSLGQTDFPWIIQGENNITTKDLNLSGLSYEAKNIAKTSYDKMENYLNDNAETDINNLADGVTGALRGYYYHYMACALSYEYSEMKINSAGLNKPLSDKIDIQFVCGFFNKNNLSQLNLENEIEKLFIEKYNLKQGSYKISVSQNTENHARGNITFFDESGEPAEGGLFLAVKTNDGWQLVFDGNGAISCTSLSEYNFPDEMMSDCYEE